MAIFAFHSNDYEVSEVQLSPPFSPSSAWKRALASADATLAGSGSSPTAVLAWMTGVGPFSEYR